MVEHQGAVGPDRRDGVRRGFPRTHYFAQARSVFAVARHRCNEVFDPPRCVTLWRLPEPIEEEFDARWEYWLYHVGVWQSFFQEIGVIQGTDLVATLRRFELINDRDIEGMPRLRRSAEGRAVPLPGVFSNSDDDITLLALGFARGEVGALAVPYAQREDA